MAQVKEADKVKVHYTGKDPEGNVFDSSLERDPLEFTVGEGKIIPGFEQALIGMEPGQSKTVTIPSDEAYGPYREDMVQEVARQDIPDNIDIEVGTRLQAQRPDQSSVILTVTNIADDKVTLDANHPLAGKDLVFDIELLEVVA